MDYRDSSFLFFHLAMCSRNTPNYGSSNVQQPKRPMTPEEKDNALFSGLVIMFQAAAMQSLGKTINPSLNKVERNLEQAQSMIDMLDMLERKAKGNLSPDEEKFLKNVVRELKLNYVDELSKDESRTKESS